MKATLATDLRSRHFFFFLWPMTRSVNLKTLFVSRRFPTSIIDKVPRSDRVRFFLANSKTWRTYFPSLFYGTWISLNIGLQSPCDSVLSILYEFFFRYHSATCIYTSNSWCLRCRALRRRVSVYYSSILSYQKKEVHEYRSHINVITQKHPVDRNSWERTTKLCWIRLASQIIACYDCILRFRTRDTEKNESVDDENSRFARYSSVIIILIAI